MQVVVVEARRPRRVRQPLDHAANARRPAPLTRARSLGLPRCRRSTYRARPRAPRRTAPASPRGACRRRRAPAARRRGARDRAAAGRSAEAVASASARSAPAVRSPSAGPPSGRRIQPRSGRWRSAQHPIGGDPREEVVEPDLERGTGPRRLEPDRPVAQRRPQHCRPRPQVGCSTPPCAAARGGQPLVHPRHRSLTPGPRTTTPRRRYSRRSGRRLDRVAAQVVEAERPQRLGDLAAAGVGEVVEMAAQGEDVGLGLLHLAGSDLRGGQDLQQRARGI